jgi:hypothetical protein
VGTSHAEQRCLAAGISIPSLRNAYQAVKGKDFVAVVLLDCRVFVQPPRPFADEGGISWHEGSEPEEELGDVIVKEVAKERGDLDRGLDRAKERCEKGARSDNALPAYLVSPVRPGDNDATRLRIPPHPNMLGTLRDVFNLLHTLLVSLLDEMHILSGADERRLFVAGTNGLLSKAFLGERSAQKVVDVYGDLAFPKPEGGLYFQLDLHDETGHAKTASEQPPQQRLPSWVRKAYSQRSQEQIAILFSRAVYDFSPFCAPDNVERQYVGADHGIVEPASVRGGSDDSCEGLLRNRSIVVQGQSFLKEVYVEIFQSNASLHSDGLALHIGL